MAFTSETTSLAFPIVHFQARTGVYPANNEVWWSYKRPTEIGSDEPPKTYLEVFDPAMRHQVARGNTLAPRGHYILDAFNLDRTAASGVASIPVVSSGGNRPAAVAFYAGRVFYAGVNSKKFNTKIYFSQILEGEKEIPKCYQAGDPTSEDLYELLPSDGGVLTVPEIADIVYIKPVSQSLFVFATNGVWEIAGSEGVGFRANDFSVNKVSGNGALSITSFVDVEGLPIWWNRAGIHTLAVTDQGAFYVQSLSDTAIKTFYLDIPEECKAFAKGVYDPLERLVYFLYRSTTPTVLAERYSYDSFLVLNVKTGGWYPWRLSGLSTAMLRGGISLGGRQTLQSVFDITVEGVQVTVGGEDVTAFIAAQSQISSQLKFPVYVTNQGLTFAENLSGHRDWVSIDDLGFSFDSYFTSGYKLLGEGNKDFQSNIVTVNYEPFEDGGAYIQGKWDYSTDSVTGRWSTSEQIYRPDSLFKFKNRKVKIRGQGEALQVHVYSDGDKPFGVNGWIVHVTGNSSP
jgi:hypothetical protein